MNLVRTLVLVAFAVAISIAVGVDEGASASPHATAAQPKFLFNPILGPPLLESPVVRQGQPVVLQVDVGCRHGLNGHPYPEIDDHVREVVIQGSTVEVTINASFIPQCIIPLRTYRFLVSSSLSPGNYQVRLFVRSTDNFVTPHPSGPIPLQVLAVEPVPAAAPSMLALLILGLAVAGLAALRLRG